VNTGSLVLVATPIGNLGDLSERARAVLAEADAICCEDTRHSGQLLSRIGVAPKRLISLHAHNEVSRVGEVLGLLAAGAQVAVVSDAGTPAVSDPGARLVDAVHDAGYLVSILPGPSAAPAAIALSGFQADRWCFEGFLPARGTERRARLGEIAASKMASVIYESPRRVDGLIGELALLCRPERRLLVVRELTKLHEEVWRGRLVDAAGRWPGEEAKGEFVLVLEQAPEEPGPELSAESVGEMLEALLAKGLSRRDAVEEVAARTGKARREIYELAGTTKKGPAEPL
jgi:16S rRNA (cytidine1402-2'-O)-methyltransferase